VIVTHNMQQAARVADYTGFFLMGKLIEYDKRKKYSPLRPTNVRKTTLREGLDNAKPLPARAG